MEEEVRRGVPREEGNRPRSRSSEKTLGEPHSSKGFVREGKEKITKNSQEEPSLTRTLKSSRESPSTGPKASLGGKEARCGKWKGGDSGRRHFSAVRKMKKKGDIFKREEK